MGKKQNIGWQKFLLHKMVKLLTVNWHYDFSIGPRKVLVTANILNLREVFPCTKTLWKLFLESWQKAIKWSWVVHFFFGIKKCIGDSKSKQEEKEEIFTSNSAEKKPSIITYVHRSSMLSPYFHIHLHVRFKKMCVPHAFVRKRFFFLIACPYAWTE